MDAKGYEKIREALDEAAIINDVTPRPKADEEVQFVTIETDVTTQPALVLNALHKAQLLFREGERSSVRYHSPELNPIGINRGSLTFEDMNDGNVGTWG
jgi:hypothetical protein